MPGLNRRWIVFLFMFVCALFPETSSSASLEPIKIASTGPGISILPLEIAATKGSFALKGLNVLTITMRANIAVNALLTRNVSLSNKSTIGVLPSKPGGSWQVP